MALFNIFNMHFFKKKPLTSVQLNAYRYKLGPVKKKISVISPSTYFFI